MIQLSRRTVALALAAFVAFAMVATTSLVLTLTGRADASHKFTDIGDSSWVHDSTAWLADNSIADGYDDGTFKERNNITRGQASFWFSNYNDSIELVEKRSFQTGDRFRETAECPAGKRAVAGSGGTSREATFMTDSFPDTASGGSGWTVLWERESVVTLEVWAWALCVPKTIPE